MSRHVIFSAVILLFGFSCYFYFVVHSESLLVNQDSSAKNNEHTQGNPNLEAKSISFKNSSLNSSQQEMIEPKEIKGHHREIISCNVKYESNKSNQKAVFDKLRNSPNLDEQLHYAMASQFEDNNERVRLLRTYSQQNKPSRLSNWALLMACQSASICDEKIESDIIANDENNTALWLNIAALRLKNNDSYGVVEALENASSSPEFNDYFVDQIDFYNSNLANNFDLSIKERHDQATSFDNMGGLLEILNFCKQSISEKGENTHLCLTIGEKLEKDSKFEIGAIVGLNLQKTAFSHLRDELNFHNTLKKLEFIRERVRSDEYQKTLALLQYDESLFKDWLDNLTQFNAIDSTKNIINEAIFLSQNEYYNPCS